MVRQERERRFISEYLVTNFEAGQWALNVPLGPVPTELIELRGLKNASALVRPQRRRVDGVAWDQDHYWIIEAKIRDPFEGIGRLIVYKDEAEAAPDLPGFDQQTIIPRLVVPYIIDRDRIAASRHDIELVQFLPGWIAEYVAGRQLYHTAEFRAAREERKRTLNALGLE